jgi:hypothetical protein
LGAVTALVAAAEVAPMPQRLHTVAPLAQEHPRRGQARQHRGQLPQRNHEHLPAKHARRGASARISHAPIKCARNNGSIVSRHAASCATNGLAIDSVPSVGQTTMTAVPRRTTRPSDRVASVSRSGSSGSDARKVTEGTSGRWARLGKCAQTRCRACPRTSECLMRVV